MKKMIFRFLAVVVIAAGATACKKGENDPFLSLRSRKARLTGEWKVSSASFTTVSDGVTTSTSTYDGNHQTGTFNFGGTNIDVDDYFTHEYTFEKDGTFKEVMTYTDGSGFVSTLEGNWVFMGKSKSGELKNKEAIVLSPTTMTDAAGGSSYVETYKGSLQPYDYMILDQLKNKEIIIKINETDNSNGSTTTRTGTMTLTKK